MIQDAFACMDPIGVVLVVMLLVASFIAILAIVFHFFHCRQLQQELELPTKERENAINKALKKGW